MTLPIGITLSYWAASLVIDFPNDNIPLLSSEDQWKPWGNILVQTNSFASNGAPGTDLYSDAPTWMQAVYRCMANF